MGNIDNEKSIHVLAIASEDKDILVLPFFYSPISISGTQGRIGLPSCLTHLPCPLIPPKLPISNPLPYLQPSLELFPSTATRLKNGKHGAGTHTGSVGDSEMRLRAEW